MTIEIIAKELDSINPIVVIKDKDSMIQATETLSKLNVLLDNLTKEKEKITKPLNEALKEVRSKYKPTETALEQNIDSIRQAMSKFQTEQLRIQKVEEDKIANRIGEGKGKLKIETAIKKLNELERPEETINTEYGAIKFRTDRVLKVVDISAIPDEYFDLNDSRLLKALKAGTIVAGATLEDKLVPINSR